jgi:LPS sulfotransferase NodH
MLCSALRQTGIAGRPAEYFGQTLWENLMNNRNLLMLSDVRDLMDRVIEVSTTENGVFGTKLPANHAGMFMRRAAEHRGKPFTSLRVALESEFPNLRYIHLMRENKVAQAVSLYRAIMTGVWRRDEHYGPTHVPGRPVEYDQYAIQRCYQDIIASDAYWDGFFRNHGLSPVLITYERLLTDYESEIRGILTQLGLPSRIEIPRPQTIKLADERSAEWEQEFRKHGRFPEREPGITPETFGAPY